MRWWAAHRPGTSRDRAGLRVRERSREPWNPAAALADRALDHGRLPYVKLDTLRFDPYGLGADKLLGYCERELPQRSPGSAPSSRTRPSTTRHAHRAAAAHPAALEPLPDRWGTPMRGERAAPVRPPRASNCWRTGLVDRDWVGAQLGTAFATDEAAADRYLDGEDCSPHPLFEALWCDVAAPWRGEGIDALSGTSATSAGAAPSRRTRWSTWPRSSTSTPRHGPILRAARLVGGLGRRGLTGAGAAGVPAISWGRLRAAALDAASRRDEGSGVRLAQRRTKTRPEAGPETPPRPRQARDAEPLVTVVLAVQDEAHRLRRAVDAVQAQTFEGWELIVVDDGSGDDTPAVLRASRPSNPGS